MIPTLEFPAVQLVRGDAEVLRQVAKPCQIPPTPEMRILANRMVSIMRTHGGIGLAAPQVGHSVRLIVTETFGASDARKIWNPEIVKTGGPLLWGKEGCLSLPGKIVTVERRRDIVVKGFNELGEPIKIFAGGMFARCLQHEIDHVNGIMIARYEQGGGQ